MKFKVWNDLVKEFDTNSKFFINQNGDLHMIIMDGIVKCDPAFIPVFSTGRTDKTEAELFDRDIIKAFDVVRIVTLKPVPDECVFGEVSIQDLCFYKDDIEKIGSIHLNPELIP